MSLPINNLKSSAAMFRFVMAVALGLGLDLWTKHLAFEKLAQGSPHQIEEWQTGRKRWVVDCREDLLASHGYVVVPGFLNFNVTVNEGAVFGLGQGRRWVFVAISIAAILFLGYLFLTSGRQWFPQIIFGLLLAGVLGNMYDRIELGYVRDMIYALPRWGVFPYIFNVADSLLCVGVGLIFIYSLFRPRHAHTSQDAPPASAV
jgi:signal peptidase II